MNLIFKILADIVVLIHFFWIVFLIFGAFAGVRARAIKFLHIAGLIFAIFLQIMGWYCPLTYLEVWLRSRHDPSTAYPGSFIAHYIEKVIYIELSQSLLFFLTVTLCGVNGWFYLREALTKKRH